MNGVHRTDVLLAVENVSLAFGDRLVLRDVDATIRDLHRPGVEQGQVVSLLGPSGIGKTQLFRILAGLSTPTKGAVLLTPERLPVKAGKVGVVDQHYTLFRHRTVGENLTIAARQGGLAPAEAKDKAKALLERFQLADRWDEWPAKLSGGQRQRVAIAQQLLCSEHFLLMDEPFSGLDPNMLAEVLKLLGEVAVMHELRTLIVVTHDVASALAISDTVWLLGRDREGDEVVPGARVQREYDLIERGITWQPEVEQLPAFRELLREIKARFRTL